MKKIITLCLSLCMTAALAAPAYALEYSIDAPNDYDFGKDTSIEVIHTADGGAMRNEDVSKNAALIPPAFGSESMNALHTGEYLTPNLAPRTLPTAGAVISGSGDVVTPREHGKQRQRLSALCAAHGGGERSLLQKRLPRQAGDPRAGSEREDLSGNGQQDARQGCRTF